MAGRWVEFRGPSQQCLTSSLILACCLEYGPSLYVVLRVESTNTSPTKVLSPRLGIHGFHDRSLRNERPPREKMEVLRISIPLELASKSTREQLDLGHSERFLFCRVHASGHHILRVADASPQEIWKDNRASFILNAGSFDLSRFRLTGDHFNASLEIRLVRSFDDRVDMPLGVLTIRGHHMEEAPRFHLSFDAPGHALPWWCAHGLAFQTHYILCG